MWRTHSCAVSLSFGGPCGARTPACRVHTRVNACLRHSMLLVAVRHKSFKMFAHKKTTSRLISTPSSGRSHECERGTQECVRHTMPALRVAATVTQWFRGNLLQPSFMENPTSPAIPESLATSLEDNSFGDILSEFEQTHRGRRNKEALEGTVVSISPESVFVDIGRKVDGVLPVEKFRDESG